MSKHESAPEDVKAKFRAALDKKHAHGGADVSDHSDRSKVDHGHGPETSGREQMFRRKSVLRVHLLRFVHRARVSDLRCKRAQIAISGEGGSAGQAVRDSMRRTSVATP